MAKSLSTTNLAAVDVGYSLRGRTTGIAWIGPDSFGVDYVGTTISERAKAFPQNISFDLLCVDGPVVPPDSEINTRRHVERIFACKPFHNRCKPGFSHAGSGIRFRAATVQLLDQLDGMLVDSPGPALKYPARPRRPIIEAFPNTFLGVLLDEHAYASMPRLKRGEKFDWLYSQAIKADVFSQILAVIGWSDPRLASRLYVENHHEKRAALICLLTAAVAWAGKACVCGDIKGGWFWLPPLQLWQPWAADAIEIFCC